MRIIMSRAIRMFGLLTLITLSLAASGAGWAEQREARLPPGPMSVPVERPTPVACPLGVTTECQGTSDSECASECKIIANCAPCKDRVYQACIKSRGCQ
jgi:hypothetical protein